jgi:DNA-binding transcriptional LysR family regulator
MELRHLRVVVALADELHFGRTARRLRLAQSSISQTLKALEAELGVELFARNKRTVRLSVAGERFAEGARRTLAELALATTGARSAADARGGRLGIGFMPMASLTEIPRAIARFERSHPGVALTLEAASSAEQLEALCTGRIDVGFVALATSKSALEPLAARPVTTSPMVALMPADHRLAARRTVRLEDLAGERFVFLTQSGEPRIHALFRRRCIDAGFDPEIFLEVEHADALVAFIAEGLGVSCVPRWVERLRIRGVAFVPLRPAFRGGIAVVWHPALVSPLGHAFMETLPSAR